MMYFDPANLHRPAVSHCQAKRELTFTCYSLLLDFVLELVLAVQPSKMRNFRSSSEDLAVSVCHSLFTRQGGQPRDVVCLGSPPSLHLVPPLTGRGIGAVTSLAQDSVKIWVDCSYLGMGFGSMLHPHHLYGMWLPHDR